MSEVMIKVEGLTKDYGDFRAVNDISFEVRSGEVLGFLGPNGAGKSTTMKMLTCFLSPTSGTAVVDRSHWLVFLDVDPRFDAVRKEPRFDALRTKVGLQE